MTRLEMDGFMDDCKVKLSDILEEDGNKEKKWFSQGFFRTMEFREFPDKNALNFINNLRIVAKEKVIPSSNPDGSIIIIYKKEFV